VSSHNSFWCALPKQYGMCAGQTSLGSQRSNTERPCKFWNAITIVLELEHSNQFAGDRVLLFEFLVLFRTDDWSLLARDFVYQDANSIFFRVGGSHLVRIGAQDATRRRTSSAVQREDIFMTACLSWSREIRLNLVKLATSRSTWN